MSVHCVKNKAIQGIHDNPLCYYLPLPLILVLCSLAQPLDGLTQFPWACSSFFHCTAPSWSTGAIAEPIFVSFCHIQAILSRSQQPLKSSQLSSVTFGALHWLGTWRALPVAGCGRNLSWGKLDWSEDVGFDCTLQYRKVTKVWTQRPWPIGLSIGGDCLGPRF